MLLVEDNIFQYLVLVTKIVLAFACVAHLMLFTGWSGFATVTTHLLNLQVVISSI